MESVRGRTTCCGRVMMELPVWGDGRCVTTYESVTIILMKPIVKVLFEFYL